MNHCHLCALEIWPIDGPVWDERGHAWHRDCFNDEDGNPVIPEGSACDWGNCDEPAVALRKDTNADGASKGLPGWGGFGWLPVCENHRDPMLRS
jgi:hypothetical protein